MILSHSNMEIKEFNGILVEGCNWATDIFLNKSSHCRTGLVFYVFPGILALLNPQSLPPFSDNAITL